MKLTEQQIRDLGFMFQKMWKQDQNMLNGFLMALVGLGIPYRLIPDGKTYSAVEIADKTFKL